MRQEDLPGNLYAGKGRGRPSGPAAPRPGRESPDARQAPAARRDTNQGVRSGGKTCPRNSLLAEPVPKVRPKSPRPPPRPNLSYVSLLAESVTEPRTAARRHGGNPHPRPRSAQAGHAHGPRCHGPHPLARTPAGVGPQRHCPHGLEGRTRSVKEMRTAGQTKNKGRWELWHEVLQLRATQ